ncbi:DUF1566 domain-containing protein [Vibrio lentus]|uniref:DUF1566 domain-containing protein n=1 Tax=Vibrio lentus TaxID=136468 RepID=UPI000C85602F|nr:DUF1566 domain-containing protein [Vibrio lentus]
MSTLLMACGGAGSDEKQAQSFVEVDAEKLSGLALDGYLYKAKVCLDKNHNAICDSADGEVSTTDSNGYFELNLDNESSEQTLLVEAIANQTIDMDMPNQTIDLTFTLEIPKKHSAVVSPITSLIASVAQSSGISFDTAAQLIAQELGVEKQLAISDYAASNSSNSQELHMLARGLTRVIQEAQKASIEAGIDQINARKGAMYKLASLDLIALKAKTDLLSHGAPGTNSTLKKLGEAFKDQLTISQSDISSGAISIAPPAPKHVEVDDVSDTFNWQFVRGFNQNSDYEYSLDSGNTWSTVIRKPIHVGSQALKEGAVQVRVAASKTRNTPAGNIAVSNEAYTLKTEPAAPYKVYVDDAKSRFDWDFVDSFNTPSLYEYSLDNGTSWTRATEKPQNIADLDIPSGHLQVRVAENSTLGHLAGSIRAATDPMTVTPPKPEQPTLDFANDNSNLINWFWVDGYEAPSFYEIKLGLDQDWQDVTGVPFILENASYPEGTISIRVKSNSSNARPTGDELTIDSAFTHSDNQPVAPTNPMVDDAKDTFEWQPVETYEGVNAYEYSLDRGLHFNTVTGKPQLVDNKAFASGQVCVRVKENALKQHPPGELLCSDKTYTFKPDAPQNLVVNDIDNTLEWSIVEPYNPTDYEMSLDSGATWTKVVTMPFHVGNEARSATDVQLRVARSVSHARASGEIASPTEDFTKVFDIPVPKGIGARIINPEFEAEAEAEANANLTNGYDWDYWQKVTIGGQESSFELPQHYEYTNDQGKTWHPVVSKPQFIGTEAYDKDNVAIRLKENAKETVKNPASEPLWATTDKTGKFYAITFVPMQDLNTPVDYKKIQNNSSYRWEDFNCIAEYDNEGKGEPIFWSKKQGSIAVDQVSNTVHGLNNCGINDWKLPTMEQAIELSKRGGDKLPSNLIKRGTNYWANDNDSYVIVRDGGIVDSSPFVKDYISATWALPTNQGLLNLINNETITIDNTPKTINELLNEQKNGVDGVLDEAKTFLTNWFSKNQTDKSYALLEFAANEKLETLSGLTEKWKSGSDLFNSKIAKYELQIKMAQQRGNTHDTQKLEDALNHFIAKTYELEQNTKTLATLIEGAEFAQKLAQIQQKNATVDVKVGSLRTSKNKGEAKAIHEASLALNQALYLLAQEREQAESFIESLNKQIRNSDDETLKTLYRNLIVQMEKLKFRVLTTFEDEANDGLKNSGYKVPEAEVLFDNERFAKLDKFGHYLDKTTTYAQGWRCVEDQRIPGKRRVWTLLKDGLPQGEDKLFYNASASGLPSILGSDGLLETTNADEGMCGFKDWSVPSLTQLWSLKSKPVKPESEYLTLNIEVFPHHLALNPEYDMRTDDDGTVFYYWSKDQKDNANMHIARFWTTNQNQETSFTSTDSTNQKITLARLVREEKVALKDYEYLDAMGKVVPNRNDAICVKDSISGLAWQIFQDVNKDELKKYRYKTYQQIQQEIKVWNNNQICGLKDWRIPSKYQLYGLFPLNTTVFKHNSLNDSKDDYVTNSPAESGKFKTLNITTFSEHSSEKEGRYETKSKLYRLVAGE